MEKNELLELEYLGTPYSNANDYLINFRAEMVDIIAHDLTMKGRAIYSPISSWHQIACKFEMSKTFEFWEKMNLSFLCKCKQLIVVMLPGYEESIGLRGEIEFAIQNDIPIEFLDPAPYFRKIEIKSNTDESYKQKELNEIKRFRRMMRNQRKF